MTGSLNKVMLLGNLGADPEVRTTQSGDKMATFSLATSERWFDKKEGAQRITTDWHRVVVFGKIAEIAEKYLHKGSKLLVEGKLKTRKWVDNSGVEKYTTEVVLTGYGTNMTMLDSRGGGEGDGGSYDSGGGGGGSSDTGLGAGGADDSAFEDDIPF